MRKVAKIKTLVVTLAGAGLVSIPGYSVANPTGGQVIAGNATIHQESATKIGITQTTDRVVIDWQKYSIGANEQVQYYQPSASSVSLNRVVGQDPSQILGRLTANGQVFLVNPNGIYFGKNAQIDVAGLVASTHNIRNEDFMAGRYLFNIPGKPGASVINEGQIRIADTGIAAFVAPSVANRGVIAAKLGKIALASANGFTLDFHGDELLSFVVSEEVAKTAFDVEGNQLTSFVENSGKIEAQGGYVLLTAKAAENAIHGVINHSGIIEATTVGQRNGEIILHAGKGSLKVSGTLNASAPESGDGGFIETSGGTVIITDGTKITTKSTYGETGTWLIDPLDFTIHNGYVSQSLSGIGAQTLANNLSNSNVTIETDAASSGNGDIFVAAPVSWSGNKLTLSAHRNIYIRESLTGSGNASLSLKYGQGPLEPGYVADYYVAAPVNLPEGYKFSTKLGSNGTTNLYYVLTNLGSAGDNTSGITTTLQGMSLSGKYALGADINASATANWYGGAGWAGIGGVASPFTGLFAGLGHIISGLTSNRQQSNIGSPQAPIAGGLFGFTDNATIRDIGLLNVSITIGNSNFNPYPFPAGALVGSTSGGVILNSFAIGTVSNPSGDAGGLVGENGNYAVISNSYANVNVAAGGYRGGLVGSNYGRIDRSYSVGSVQYPGAGGGLVGYGGGVSASYWNKETSSQGTSVGGIGKTIAQMTQQSTFGWDFTNIWTITNGQTYPLLRAFQRSGSSGTQQTLNAPPNITPSPPTPPSPQLTPTQQGYVQTYRSADVATLMVAVGDGKFRNDPDDLVWRNLYIGGNATTVQIAANRLMPTFLKFRNADTSQMYAGISAGDIPEGGYVYEALMKNTSTSSRINLVVAYAKYKLDQEGSCAKKTIAITN